MIRAGRGLGITTLLCPAGVGGAILTGFGFWAGFIPRAPLTARAAWACWYRPQLDSGRSRQGSAQYESLYRRGFREAGRYMVQHALDRGYEVVGVCRERSVGKLDRFKGRIAVMPGPTNDREVIKRAVAGCDGVLTVLVPWGVQQYATGTAQAVLDHAAPGARLIFSCGWHITRDGKDVYSWKLLTMEKVAGWLGAARRLVDLDDQVEACRRIFASDTRWTVVRGATWRRARARACRCGAGTWGIRSWRAT